MLALYDPISQPSLVQQVGFHPQVISRAVLGNVLFCLGFSDQALAQSSAAIADARRLDHSPSLAVSLAIGARVLSLLGDDVLLGTWVDQLLAVTTEKGFPHWGAQGTIYRGWAKVKNAAVTEGVSLLRSGSMANRATGAQGNMPYQIALLAATCEIAGQLEEGVTLLNDALQIVENTGERWFASDLIRLKGQLLLRQGRSEAAEELYREALSIAREQEAKMWESRAAMSLARLRRDQGHPAEARHLLEPVYGWFTEGFDTPDLKDAKALLDELEGD